MAQVAVITGASAGIGRATARVFARNGWDVALLARGEEGLKAAAAEVEELGGRALVIPTDVADHCQVDAAADRAARELGSIDVWINNAFAGMFSMFMDMQPDEFERVTSVTYLGQVNGTRAALRHMLPQDSGSIVLVGSALAYRGIPLQSAYCGAKHALQGFLDSVRTELLHLGTGVQVTMVQLPGVNTPQFDWVRARLRGRPQPVGAVYQPEVAARAIWKAAHSKRKQWIVGAPAYQAIIGDTLASPLLDRYLAATGVDAQQASEPLEPGRKDNLFDPVPGDHGAHGRFDGKARTRSPLLWASEHRGLVAAGAALAAGASLLGISRRNRKDRDNEPG